MRIDHTNHAAHAHGTRRPEPPSPGPRTTSDATTEATTEATTAASVASAPTRGKASGVVDKLASGHFNDVAALRLRTNHAEAIAAAGVELPEAPTEAARSGQGFAKALAAYQAALPPTPDPVAETLEDAVAEPPAPGIGDPLTASTDTATEADVLAVLASDDTVLDVLTVPTEESLDVAL